MPGWGRPDEIVVRRIFTNHIRDPFKLKPGAETGTLEVSTHVVAPLVACTGFVGSYIATELGPDPQDPWANAMSVSQILAGIRLLNFSPPSNADIPQSGLILWSDLADPLAYGTNGYVWSETGDITNKVYASSGGLDPPSLTPQGLRVYNTSPGSEYNTNGLTIACDDPITVGTLILWFKVVSTPTQERCLVELADSESSYYVSSAGVSSEWGWDGTVTWDQVVEEGTWTCLLLTPVDPLENILSGSLFANTSGSASMDVLIGPILLSSEQLSGSDVQAVFDAYKDRYAGARLISQTPIVLRGMYAWTDVSDPQNIDTQHITAWAFRWLIEPQHDPPIVTKLVLSSEDIPISERASFTAGGLELINTNSDSDINRTGFSVQFFGFIDPDTSEIIVPEPVLKSMSIWYKIVSTPAPCTLIKLLSGSGSIEVSSDYISAEWGDVNWNDLAVPNTWINAVFTHPAYTCSSAQLFRGGSQGKGMHVIAGPVAFYTETLTAQEVNRNFDHFKDRYPGAQLVYVP